MSMIVSKVGVHCVGPKRKGYGPFLQMIAEAGRELSVVKVRDDCGAVDEPLALWPGVLTIGSFTDFDRLPFDFDAFKARAVLNPKIKIWEVLNEEDSSTTYAAKADLYISLAPRFAEMGWSLCMFNCSSGTPPYPDEDDGVSYREVARACKFMRDNGFTAYLGLHEYVTSSDTIGRYRKLADYLEANNALIPIVITEWLFETFPGKNTFLSAAKQNDPVYMADKRVLGCATFTLGGAGWAGSNYQDVLPELAEYVAAVAPVAPLSPKQ